MAAQRPVMLNLGAGLGQDEAWINYDRSRVARVAHNPVARALVAAAARLGLASKGEILDWPKSTRTADLTKGIPHGDGTVDAVYSSHMLEHVTRDQAEFVLRECHRVLRPGGTLRVVVPDLRLLARKYLDGDRAFFGDHDGPLADAFVRSLYLRSVPKGRLPERLARRVLRTDEGGHQWMYDGESMSRLIARAGFRDVRVRAYGEGDHAAAAALDWRPHDSVHVEAVK
jgi:SAM-dependent methyltransferase